LVPSAFPARLPVAIQVGEQAKRMPGGTGSNPFSQLVEDAEGLDKIEALQVRLWRVVCAARHAVCRVLHHTHLIALLLRRGFPNPCFALVSTPFRPQEHQNEDLYEKAVQMLETYFECEEGDDQNLAPQMAGNQYAFGQQAAQVRRAL
jgi:hypothetical protein